MLKLDQFITVLPVVVTVNWEPWVEMLAAPCVTTGWEGLADNGHGDEIPDRPSAKAACNRKRAPAFVK
jgi:hypothetical protein